MCILNKCGGKGLLQKLLLIYIIILCLGCIILNVFILLFINNIITNVSLRILCAHVCVNVKVYTMMENSLSFYNYVIFILLVI